MNTSFTFHFIASSDLLIEAHRDGDDILIDHVWLKNTDILPVLEYEEKNRGSCLLDELYNLAKEEKERLHRRSLMV